MDLKHAHYFAYGSNMDEEQMKKRGINFFKKHQGKLKGWRLTFVNFLKYKQDGGYANIEKDENSFVEGIIYEVDESIEKMDKYECVPIDYFKEKLNIKSKDNEFECLVYVGNKENIGKEKKPTKEYKDHLLKGKKFLSEKYYEELENIETID